MCTGSYSITSPEVVIFTWWGYRDTSSPLNALLYILWVWWICSGIKSYYWETLQTHCHENPHSLLKPYRFTVMEILIISWDLADTLSWESSFSLCPGSFVHSSSWPPVIFLMYPVLLCPWSIYLKSFSCRPLSLLSWNFKMYINFFCALTTHFFLLPE